MKKSIIALLAVLALIIACGCSAPAAEEQEEPSTTTFEFGNYSIIVPTEWGDPIPSTDMSDTFKEDAPGYLFAPEGDNPPFLALTDMTGFGVNGGGYLLSIRPINGDGETEYTTLNGMDACRTWYTTDEYKVTYIYCTDNAEVTAVLVEVMPLDADQSAIDLFQAVEDSVMHR